MSFSGSRLTTTSALVHLFQYSAVMFSLSQTPFSVHSSLPEAAGPQTETRHAQHDLNVRQAFPVVSKVSCSRYIFPMDLPVSIRNITTAAALRLHSMRFALR